MTNVRLQRVLAADSGGTVSTVSRPGVARTEKTLPRHLSGGRPGLAVALVNDPPVMPADEATAELDFDSERQMLDLLRTVVDKETTSVVASDSPRVLAVSDPVVRMDEGQISRIDDPKDNR